MDRGSSDVDAFMAAIDEVRAERDRYREALEAIRQLWTDPKPAQRQDVAYQEAVRIASRALEQQERGDD